MGRTNSSAAVSTTTGAFAAVTSLLALSGRVRVGLSKEGATGTTVNVFAVDDTTTPGATTTNPPGRYLGSMFGPTSGLDIPDPAPAALAFYRVAPASAAPAVDVDITGDTGARTPVTVAAPTVLGDFTAAQSLASFSGGVIVAWAKEATSADVVQVWAVDDLTLLSGSGTPKGRPLGYITGPQGSNSRIPLPETLPSGLVFKRIAGTAARNVKVYGRSDSGATPSSAGPDANTLALRTGAGALEATDFNGGTGNPSSLTGQSVDVLSTNTITITSDDAAVNVNAGTSFALVALDGVTFTSSGGFIGLTAPAVTIEAAETFDLTSPAISLGSGLMVLNLGAYGLQVPNVTTAQRNAVASPQQASVLYDLDEHWLYVRSNLQWQVATSMLVRTYFQRATVDQTMAVTGAETAWPSASGLNAVTVPAVSGDVVTTRAKMRTSAVSGSPSLVWRIKHTLPDASVEYSGYDAGSGAALDWTFTSLTTGNHVFELEYTNSAGGTSFRCFPATAQESCSFTVEHKRA